MKVSLAIALSSTAVLLLAGCASTHEVARQSVPSHPEGTVVEDQKYVSLVENIAKQRGTRVVWVNPPKKRTGDMASNSR